MTENHTPTQLTLLPSDTPLRPADKVPVRFRLDEATRRRGLQHVAELRRLLATRQAAKSAQPTTRARAVKPADPAGPAGATDAGPSPRRAA